MDLHIEMFQIGKDHLNLLVASTQLDMGLANFSAHNFARIFKLYQNLQHSKNKSTEKKRKTEIPGKCESKIS